MCTVDRRVDHIRPVLHTPHYASRDLLFSQNLELVQVRIDIAHTLLIQVLRWRSLEVLDALDEVDARAGLSDRSSLQELVRALRLVRLP